MIPHSATPSEPHRSDARASTCSDAQEPTAALLSALLSVLTPEQLARALATLPSEARAAIAAALSGLYGARDANPRLG